jgi:hypothetical protein
MPTCSEFVNCALRRANLAKTWWTYVLSVMALKTERTCLDLIVWLTVLQALSRTMSSTLVRAVAPAAGLVTSGTLVSASSARMATSPLRTNASQLAPQAMF